jgi:hypothetical protein
MVRAASAYLYWFLITIGRKISVLELLARITTQIHRLATRGPQNPCIRQVARVALANGIYKEGTYCNKRAANCLKVVVTECSG